MYFHAAPWADGDPQRMQRLEVILDIHVLSLNWLHHWICHLIVEMLMAIYEEDINSLID